MTFYKVTGPETAAEQTFLSVVSKVFSYASSSSSSCEPVSQSAGGQSFGLELSLELASLFFLSQKKQLI